MFVITVGNANIESEGEIINLTPHDVVLMRDDGSTWVIPPEKTPARMIPADTDEDNVFFINGFPVSPAPKYVGYIGLPEPTLETEKNLYIVSVVVGTAMQNTNYALKNRLIGPDTGASAVRVDGKIVAVRGFVMY